MNIAERDILYGVIRQTGDRTARFRTAGGDDIAEDDVSECPDVRLRLILFVKPGPVTQSHENRDRDAFDGHVGYRDAVEGAAIHDFQSDAGQASLAAVNDFGIARRAYRTVGDGDVLKTAAGLGSHFDRITMAADNTIGDGHILARRQRKALEHDGVVVGIDSATADNDIPTAINVETVVIVADVIEDGNVANG